MTYLSHGTIMYIQTKGLDDMSSQAKVYLRHFEDRGFITFTVVDSGVRDFMELLEQKGIKYRLEQFESFVAVSMVGNGKPKKRTRRV